MLFTQCFTALIFTHVTYSHVIYPKRQNNFHDTEFDDGPAVRLVASSGNVISNVSFDDALSLQAEAPPGLFNVRVKATPNGKYFPEKYLVYQAIVDCAVQAALEPWTKEQRAFKCQEAHASMGLAFTSNKSPQPSFESRSIQWTLFYLYEWWTARSFIEVAHLQEMIALAFIGTDIRLGILQVYFVDNTAPSVMTIDRPYNSPSTSGTAGTTSSMDLSNGTVSLDVIKTEPVEDILRDGVINVDIVTSTSFKIVCRDTQFWKAVLLMIANIGYEDVDGFIGAGKLKYHEDGNFTLAIQPTSRAAGAQGILKNWIALRALQIMSFKMARGERDGRFKNFEGTITTGTMDTWRRGTRIVGKILFLPGDRAAEAHLGSDLSEPDSLGNVTVEAVS